MRGVFAAGVELAGGATEVVLNKSLFMGGPGPLVRAPALESSAERRVFFIDSILAGPGPIIQLSQGDPVISIKPLFIRTYGSVFGRLYGVGIASVISSASSAVGAAKQIDWGGDHNRFAGWKGFFACGRDPVVTIPGLAEVRSTWNSAELESQEYPTPWLPHRSDLAAVTSAELEPYVLNRENILRQVAQPRAGLFQKAIGKYASPAIPEPVAWALERPTQSRNRPVPVDAVAPKSKAEGKSPRAKVTKANPARRFLDIRHLGSDVCHRRATVGRRPRSVLARPIDARTETRPNRCGWLGHPSIHAGKAASRTESADSRRTVGRVRAPLMVTRSECLRRRVD